ACGSSATRSEHTSLSTSRLNDCGSVRGEATISPPRRGAERSTTPRSGWFAGFDVEPVFDPPHADPYARIARSAIHDRTRRVCLVKNWPAGQEIGRRFFLGPESSTRILRANLAVFATLS